VVNAMARSSGYSGHHPAHGASSNPVPFLVLPAGRRSLAGCGNWCSYRGIFLWHYRKFFKISGLDFSAGLFYIADGT
jgi:hypothetical protein